MSSSAAFPLTAAGVGSCVRLERIRAGEKLTHRLAEMGLTPGVELCVVQDAGGPLLLAVRGSRLALGRGMAHKMLVSPLPYSQSS